MTIENNYVEIFELLLEYVFNNNVIIELDEKDIDENYTFFNFINDSNVEMAKLYLKYANKNVIKFE